MTSPGRDVARDVVLREVTLADLQTLFEHQRDPEASRMAVFPPREWPAFEAHWRKILADPAVLARAIVAGGEVAGNIGAFDVGDERRVGYFLGRGHWGKGIATAALAAFLAIERRRPLHAHVATSNVASRRVLEKCGFAVAGEDDGAATDGVAELFLRLDD